MSFDASLPVSGFDVSQILSDDKHYSAFLCGSCEKMVSLDSVVTSCSHPFCRKCLEQEATDSFMKQRTCLCPTCDADLEDVSPSQSMQFGSVRVAAKSMQESQPLAYSVLCLVQVACLDHSPTQCSWCGDYGEFLKHATCHLNGAERRKSNPKMDSETSKTIEKEATSKKDKDRRASMKKGDKRAQQSGLSTLNKLESVDQQEGVTEEQYQDWNTSINSSQGFWVGGDSDSDSESDQDGEDESDEFSPGESSRELVQTIAKAEKLKKQANAKFNKGDFSTARALYTKGIDAMSKIKAEKESECKLLSNMHSNRAVTFYRDKRFDEAIEDCEAAIEFEPTLDKSWIRKWRGMMAKGDFEDAYSFLRQATRELPESKKIQEEYRKTRSEMDAFRKTQALMGKGEIVSARKLLHDIIDSCDNVALLAFSAKIDLTVGESASALEKINKALRFNPEYVDGLELRGMSYYMAGDTEKGAHLLYEAYNQHKDSAQIKAALGRVQNTHAAYTQARSFVKRGRYKEAIEEFDTAIDSSDPLPPLCPLFAMLRTERAESYLLSLQFVAALKDCQEVVNVCREYAPAWVVRSEVLIALGKAEDAKKELTFARRTWGVDNPTIEEGYQRVDFELRVVQANNDTLAFQKDLERGTSDRLPSSKEEVPLRSSSHRKDLHSSGHSTSGRQRSERSALGRGGSVRVGKNQQIKTGSSWNSVSHFDTSDLGNSFTDESTPYDKPSLSMTSSLDRRTKKISEESPKSKSSRRKSEDSDGRGDRRSGDSRGDRRSGDDRGDRRSGDDRGDRRSRDGGDRRQSSNRPVSGGSGSDDDDRRNKSSKSSSARRPSISQGDKRRSSDAPSSSSRARRPSENYGDKRREETSSGRRQERRRSNY